MGDLKCANLLLTHDANTGATTVKITDFGCSKSCSTRETTTHDGEHSMVGSIFWMAPEVLRGKVKLARPADIWSLGCCVVEMTTAQAPWADRKFDNIVQAIKIIVETDEVPSLPDPLPDVTRCFAQACLKRIPAERPSAADLSRHALLGFTAGA